MPEQAVRLNTVLAEGATDLERAGLPEPRREALRIWSELSQSSAMEALLADRILLEPSAVQRYRKLVERRSIGEPLAHVTGWAGFRHLVLRCDRRALIPRPETEGLVELLLERQRTGRVADIGTGSGCLALSLAREGSFDLILGLDRSAEALALAQINRQLTKARIDLIRADLCSALADQSLDALISNPPYLTKAEYGRLDPAVREWEPEVALASGEDGLEATARLLQDGRRVLRAGGWLMMEVDCTRAQAGAQAAAALGWEDASIHVDLFGRERYLLARRSRTS
jgi:release factor glutamine methyltransferase